MPLFYGDEWLCMWCGAHLLLPLIERPSPQVGNLCPCIFTVHVPSLLLRHAVIRLWNRAQPSDEAIIVSSHSHHGAVLWWPFLLLDDAEGRHTLYLWRHWLSCKAAWLKCVCASWGGGGGEGAWDESEKDAVLCAVCSLFTIPFFHSFCVCDLGNDKYPLSFFISSPLSFCGIMEENDCLVSLPHCASLIGILWHTPGRGTSFCTVRLRLIGKMSGSRHTVWLWIVAIMPM